MSYLGDLPERLAAMVEEDTKHLPKTTVELAQSPLSARANDAIFALRDEEGFVLFYTSGTRTDSTFRGPAFTALVAMGDEAVPALMAALGDRRFTRAKGMDDGSFPDLFTVGDAALAALEKIADRSFQGRWEKGFVRAGDGASPAAREAVEKWWKERRGQPR